MMLNVDAIDLEVWLPDSGWVPVHHEDVHHDNYQDVIADVGRTLRDVGLGTKLRWGGVPGALAPWEVADGVAATLPPMPGKVFAVWIMPGSIVVFAEREIDGEPATSAARLTLSQPPRMVELQRSCLPTSRATWFGEPERALERLIVEVDAVAAGPAVALVALAMPNEPTELIQVGRAIGLAWARAGAPPHVVWMSADRARAMVHESQRENVISVFLAAGQFFGCEGFLVPPDQRPTGPLLDYSALLDRGERVTCAMPILYTDTRSTDG